MTARPEAADLPTAVVPVLRAGFTRAGKGPVAQRWGGGAAAAAAARPG
ncbi:hypothetical protein [Nocardia abscessus]|nr:hypothetical protein [Nocardia abscessus]